MNDMVEIQNPIIKKKMIEQILLDINEVPLVYLKTLQAIIHSFKENVSIIPTESIPSQAIEAETVLDDFDWDNLLEDIHSQRQANNQHIHQKIEG
jgi:hypothetical protein